MDDISQNRDEGKTLQMFRQTFPPYVFCSKFKSAFPLDGKEGKKEGGKKGGNGEDN